MFTAILIYYGGCALGLVGIAKGVEYLSKKGGKNSKTKKSSSSSYSSYEDNLGFDGEPNGMPYMP